MKNLLNYLLVRWYLYTGKYVRFELISHDKPDGSEVWIYGFEDGRFYYVDGCQPILRSIPPALLRGRIWRTTGRSVLKDSSIVKYMTFTGEDGGKQHVVYVHDNALYVLASSGNSTFWRFGMFFYLVNVYRKGELIDKGLYPLHMYHSLGVYEESSCSVKSNRESETHV